MAIYTRFGARVSKVLKGNLQNGHIDVVCVWDDGSMGEYQTYTNELKADGGFAEIAQAIEAANRERKVKGK